MTNLAIFLSAACLEIAGCFAFWAWLKHGAHAASTNKERTLVRLHVYFHPAAAQTNYVGVWRAPFFRGWAPADSRDVSGMVRPGGDPYDFSISGIVTDKVGTYSFDVRLDAAQEGVPAGNRITLDIPVTVTSSASATAERDFTDLVERRALCVKVERI